jgi:hypothetical protein
VGEIYLEKKKEGLIEKTGPTDRGATLLRKGRQGTAAFIRTYS